MAEEGSSSALPLDIIHVLISIVIRPSDQPFQTMPFPVADHQRHIYSITVSNGIGSLSSGSPVARSTPEFTRQVSTADDDCPSNLKEIADSLKPKVEEVNDISIQEFVLQFGLIENEDESAQDSYLLGCEGSNFTPSTQLEPFISSMTIFSLFYAVEMSVNPIASQCITRGKFCSAGTQSMERSKVISYHISCIAQAIKTSESKSNKNEDNNNNDDNKNKSKDSVIKYLKSRINLLCPKIMMSNVSVCASCFKFYSIDATQPKKNSNSSSTAKECSAANLSDHNRTLIMRKNQRQNGSPSKSENNSDKKPKNNLPIVRPPPPPNRVGSLSKSGLRVVSDNSIQALELARRTYNYNFLFLHVPPPKPEFKYKPKSTTL